MKEALGANEDFMIIRSTRQHPSPLLDITIRIPQCHLYQGLLGGARGSGGDERGVGIYF